LTAVPDKTDVLVVGGGPAGLAAAIAALAKGFDVTVVDGAHPPIDKACGEGLMPDSFGAVHKLGIRIDAEQTFPFRGIRFLGEGASVEANFPSDSGIAMRRPCLHQALVDRASETGVTLLWGRRVVGLTEGGVALDGHDTPRHNLRCRWVVGADGQNSRVRRWAGLDGARHESFRFGFRRHYRISPWTDYVEIYWGSGAQMYVSPVNRSEVSVALIERDANLDNGTRVAGSVYPSLHGRYGRLTQNRIASQQSHIFNVAFGRYSYAQAHGPADVEPSERLGVFGLDPDD